MEIPVIYYFIYYITIRINIITSRLKPEIWQVPFGTMQFIFLSMQRGGGKEL